MWSELRSENRNEGYILANAPFASLAENMHADACATTQPLARIPTFDCHLPCKPTKTSSFAAAQFVFEMLSPDPTPRSTRGYKRHHYGASELAFYTECSHGSHGSHGTRRFGLPFLTRAVSVTLLTRWRVFSRKWIAHARLARNQGGCS